jgi:hypothetical protein
MKTKNRNIKNHDHNDESKRDCDLPITDGEGNDVYDLDERMRSGTMKEYFFGFNQQK